MNKKSARIAAIAGRIAFGSVLAISFAMPANVAAKEVSVRVGSAPMYPSKNIVENAVKLKDDTTLVAVV
jgi:hypothetical protein